MITEDLDDWLAGIVARKQDLGWNEPDDALRNDGSRRTAEKRELLRRAATRTAVTGRGSIGKSLKQSRMVSANLCVRDSSDVVLESATSLHQLRRSLPQTSRTLVEERMTSGIKSYQEHLRLAEQVAYVERSQEKTREFVTEQHRLMAARSKQSVKAAYPNVAELVTPIATVIAAISALIAAAPVVARWFGQG